MQLYCLLAATMGTASMRGQRISHTLSQPGKLGQIACRKPLATSSQHHWAFGYLMKILPGTGGILHGTTGFTTGKGGPGSITPTIYLDQPTGIGATWLPPFLSPLIYAESLSTSLRTNRLLLKDRLAITSPLLLLSSSSNYMEGSSGTAA